MRSFYTTSDILRLSILAEICVPRIKLSSLRSPIRMIRQSFLFLIVMMAWLLNMMVLLLFLGLESLEKTKPTMKAWIMQPRTA